MSLNIKISIPDVEETVPEKIVTEEQIFVSSEDISVSKTQICRNVKKVAQTLATSGLFCCECPKTKYKLSPLSPGCKGAIRNYSLTILCGETELYRFELRLNPDTKN